MKNSWDVISQFNSNWNRSRWKISTYSLSEGIVYEKLFNAMQKADGDFLYRIMLGEGKEEKILWRTNFSKEICLWNKAKGLVKKFLDNGDSQITEICLILNSPKMNFEIKEPIREIIEEFLFNEIKEELFKLIREKLRNEYLYKEREIVLEHIKLDYWQ